MYNIILLLLILFTPFTLQQQQIDTSQLPGALSQIPLSGGMSATVQFVQYSDHLSYTLYLNPNNVQYWNTSICLAWIVGTPSLLLDSTHQCSFMNDTSSKACIPDIPSNPCITPIKLPDACSNIETLSGSYPLASSNYTTTTPIISVNSINTQIYPNARNTVAGKSILISLTENLNGTQQQFISCSNIRLGNGTTSNFTYYPVNNGTIQFPNHASRTLLSPIALLLFIFTLFIHTLNMISK